MKKILSFLICIAILIGTLPVSAANSKDLLNFGSFEAKGSGQWSATMRPTEYSEDIAHTGNVSVKAIGQEEHQWAIFTFKAPTLENHHKYHLSFWVYSKGDVSTVRAEIAYYIDGKRKTVSLKGGAIPVGKWIHYQSNFEINDASESPITSSSIVVNVQGLFDTYIDDMELFAGERDVTPLEEWNDADPKKLEIKGETLDLYVDQNAADGGDGSKVAPFNTFEAARDYVRTINKDMTKNIAVNIKEGFYEMDKTFKLTDEDSGSNGYYVIWRAVNGSEPCPDILNCHVDRLLFENKDPLLPGYLNHLISRNNAIISGLEKSSSSSSDAQEIRHLNEQFAKMLKECEKWQK